MASLDKIFTPILMKWPKKVLVPIILILAGIVLREQIKKSNEFKQSLIQGQVDIRTDLNKTDAKINIVDNKLTIGFDTILSQQKLLKLRQDAIIKNQSKEIKKTIEQINANFKEFKQGYDFNKPTSFLPEKINPVYLEYDKKTSMLDESIIIQDTIKKNPCLKN